LEKQQTVCLLNDSFPPLIDGVANTVVNYASNLLQQGKDPIVITPAYPEADDGRFPYPVIRYPSITALKFNGYPAGVPFSLEVANHLKDKQVSVLHSHCPVMSTLMARQLRQITNAPVVFTYHTKFDIDIANKISNKPLQLAVQKFLVSSISACDEVWAVSRGAGENLKSLGYEGDYIVMANGVDMPLGKVSAEQIAAVTKDYDLPADVPMYLFVGRMMWYKGVRVILDALAKLKQQKQAFRMVFIGIGGDYQEIVEYAAKIGIGDQCIFVGAIHSREELRAWYSRANLFLFPSTYDTNGLVVREAAACGVPSVLIRGSCAAESITDGQNGFLIEQNPDSMAACLSKLSVSQMAAAGDHAAKELYLSWGDSVAAAAERYAIVQDRHRCGLYKRPLKPMEGFMKINGELMDVLATLSNFLPGH